MKALKVIHRFVSFLPGDGLITRDELFSAGRKWKFRYVGFRRNSADVDLYKLLFLTFTNWWEAYFYTITGTQIQPSLMGDKKIKLRRHYNEPVKDKIFVNLFYFQIIESSYRSGFIFLLWKWAFNKFIHTFSQLISQGGIKRYDSVLCISVYPVCRFVPSDGESQKHRGEIGKTKPTWNQADHRLPVLTLST